MLYGLRVVAVGGGTGLSALLSGFKRFVSPPQNVLLALDSIYFADLAALVTVTDDGGSSGRLRDELHILAPGDIRNCLVALSAEESLLSSLFRYRFQTDGDLEGHSFGNLFLAALTGVTGDFYEAVRAASHVLAIRGRIFPSTTTPVSLVAETEDEKLLRGEMRISHSCAPIRRVWLDPPNCCALEDSLTAIKEADLILIGPGSLYTSLIPNLLVPGVREALSRCKAMVVYLCNIMTQPGETTGYRIRDHVGALLQHCPELRLSYVLANYTPVAGPALKRYQQEGAEQILPSPSVEEEEEKLPCPMVLADLLAAGEVARHDGVKTARILQALFQRILTRQPTARTESPSKDRLSETPRRRPS